MNVGIPARGLDAQTLSLMKTGDLFDAPIARTSDPVTSHRAAAGYDARGRQPDALKLLDMIRRYPGRTAAEYSDLFRQAGMDWYKAARMPTKRIRDLLNAGDVYAGAARVCLVTHAEAAVYYSTRD